MGDLAAFVGRNESGKTTILQALTLLNRTESVSDLDLCDEMNEELKSEINIVEGEFELTKKEVSLIKENLFNPDRQLRLQRIGRVKIRFSTLPGPKNKILIPRRMLITGGCGM